VGVIESFPYSNNGVHISEFKMGSTGIQIRYELPMV